MKFQIEVSFEAANEKEANQFADDLDAVLKRLNPEQMKVIRRVLDNPLKRLALLHELKKH